VSAAPALISPSDAPEAAKYTLSSNSRSPIVSKPKVRQGVGKEENDMSKCEVDKQREVEKDDNKDGETTQYQTVLHATTQ
jgi:hypothetical protein